MDNNFHEISFSGQTKSELSRINEEDRLAMRSEIAGFIRSTGVLSLVGLGKLNVKVSTDNNAVARHFKMLINEYFGAETSITVTTASSIKTNKIFEVNITEPDSCEMILRECGILLVREGCNYISDGIYSELVSRKIDKKAYIRGLFLGAGSISNPEKSYHLEFVFNTDNLAQDTKKLLNSFSLKAKVVQRKKSYIVYIKDSEKIADLLKIMGANEQVFKFEDTRVYKDVRNRVNRINNCDAANMDKSINAAMRQLEAIKIIENKYGLQVLPEKLRKVAEARLENPEISIKELGDMMTPPMSKSGVNHRLNKILEKAEKMGG